MTEGQNSHQGYGHGPFLGLALTIMAVNMEAKCNPDCALNMTTTLSGDKKHYRDLATVNPAY